MKIKHTPNFLAKIKAKKNLFENDYFDQSENAVKDARNIALLLLIIIILLFVQIISSNYLTNKVISNIVYFDYIETLISTLKINKYNSLYGKIVTPSQNPYPKKHNMGLANILFEFNMENVGYFDIKPSIVYQGINGCDARVFEFNNYSIRNGKKSLLINFVIYSIFNKHNVVSTYLVHFSNNCDPDGRSVKMITLLFKCRDKKELKFISINIFKDYADGKYKIINRNKIRDFTNYTSPYGEYSVNKLDDIEGIVYNLNDFDVYNYNIFDIRYSITSFQDFFLRSTRSLLGEVFSSNEYKVAVKSYLKALSSSKSKLFGFSLGSFELLVVGPFFFLWLTISFLHRVRRIKSNKTENIWIIIHRKGMLENIVSIIILLLLLFSPISLLYFYTRLDYKGEYLYYWMPFYMASQILMIRVIFWELRRLRK